MSDPAFPYHGPYTRVFPDGGTSTGPGSFLGLTKREWFAGLAMQGLLSNGAFVRDLVKYKANDGNIRGIISDIATQYSDDLIKRLEKK